MKKKYEPQIRIISVEHDKTIEGERLLTHALKEHGITVPLRNVFCHLEAGRCGIKSGKVAIEVDGSIIFEGENITPELSEQFCKGLPRYIAAMEKEYGIKPE